MRFPRLISPGSVTDSLIDLDMACNNSKPREPGIESSNTDDLWNNLFVPDKELVDYNSSGSTDRTSSPLTAKNLEVLNNSITFNTSKHSKKSSRASTDHSDPAEEIVKQKEHPDRQELLSANKRNTETTIASILSLYRNSSPLKLVRYQNLDIVGDLVGRLIHFDLREPFFPRSQYFGPPPPVAGKHGLLSWFTSQEKMAESIIKSGSHDFFHWGWNPAIFSRSVRLGVRTPCQVPYCVKSKAGSWYTPEEDKEEVRNHMAWGVLQKFTCPVSETSPKISYGFRALAKDFFSGKLVHEDDYYARLIEPENSTDDENSTENLFHITNIDMGKYRQNLYRNLYGPNREILQLDKAKDGPGLEDIVNIFLVEVIKVNEVEDALVLIEKTKKLEKSSFTVAKVHGADVRRSSKYHKYIEKLNTLEKNKKEAGKAAARVALEDLVRNLNTHGLDSIMGSETWSLTHISTIPTLDEPVEELTIIESNKADEENRPTSPLSIPESSESKNVTAPKKKKKSKGKTNAKKFKESQEETLISDAVSETMREPVESDDKTFLSIASDPLNYDFDDSENPVVDDDSNWETVKGKLFKPKGPRATLQVDPARSAKQCNKNVGRKGEMEPSGVTNITIAASTTKTSEKFEIESFNDFPAITSPSKKLVMQKTDVVVQQPTPPDTHVKVSASGENVVNAQISAATTLPLVSEEQCILPPKFVTKNISTANEYDFSADVDLTQNLTHEAMAKEVAGAAKSVSTWYEAGGLNTSLSEVLPPLVGLNLKDHAPIYLGGILDVPSRAPRLRKSRRSCSAYSRIPTSPTLVVKRPSSGCANISYADLVIDNTAAVDLFPIAGRISMGTTVDNISSVQILSAVDSIYTDTVAGTTSAITKSPVSDSASLDTVVNNASKVEDSCSSEVQTDSEEAPLLGEASQISVSDSASVTSSTMTIHGPQPQGFHPSFMGLGFLDLEFAVRTALANQTQNQQTIVASYDVEEESISQFSNGWSKQKLSASAIIHTGQHTHAESGSGCIPFSCTYCAKHYYATIESPMVLCHGCGTNSGINYCSVACLLAGSLSHADACQETVHNSESFMENYPSAYQIYYAATFLVSPPDELAVKTSTYCYRQKAFSMHCSDGPFPQLLRAWARKNNLTLEAGDSTESTKKTGSYFIFKSGLSSNGRRTNPDSTVICTIKFRHDDHMVQIVARCLRACFSSHCHNDIKEFLFRLIKNYLSDEDSFGQFPHTENRTTVFYEFQHQFHLEFGFHADMQRNSSAEFDFELEWPIVEHLLSDFETGELV